MTQTTNTVTGKSSQHLLSLVERTQETTRSHVWVTMIWTFGILTEQRATAQEPQVPHARTIDWNWNRLRISCLQPSPFAARTQSRDFTTDQLAEHLAACAQGSWRSHARRTNPCVLFFFGHRPKRFCNDRKQLSHFGLNVWNYRLKHTALASLNTTVRKMTKMFWCPNVSAKNDQNISAKKNSMWLSECRNTCGLVHWRFNFKQKWSRMKSRERWGSKFSSTFLS